MCKKHLKVKVDPVIWLQCPICAKSDVGTTVLDTKHRAFKVTTQELTDADGFIVCEFCGTKCVQVLAPKDRRPFVLVNDELWLIDAANCNLHPFDSKRSDAIAFGHSQLTTLLDCARDRLPLVEKDGQFMLDPYYRTPETNDCPPVDYVAA